MLFGLDDLSIEEIVQGYHKDEETRYVCLECGKVFEQGEVFQIHGRFFDALAAIKKHVQSEHPKYFQTILEGDSKYITFTDNQKQLFLLMHKGLSDSEIAKKLELSPSTVRHQRFVFREKAKHAKMYLALYQIAVEGKGKKGEEIMKVHDSAKMLDERYIITDTEREKVIETFFDEVNPLRLRALPVKEKKKVVVLSRIAQEFAPGRTYTEKEVNTILKSVNEDDYVTLRRYLIEYGFMDRKNDGSAYWCK